MMARRLNFHGTRKISVYSKISDRSNLDELRHEQYLKDCERRRQNLLNRNMSETWKSELKSESHKHSRTSLGYQDSSRFGSLKLPNR